MTGICQCLPTTTFVCHQLEEGGSSKSSIFSRMRFTLNWEKVLYLGNVALLTATVAYAMFIQLPLLAVGLGVFEFFYINGRNNSSNSFRNIYQLRSELNEIRYKNKNLEKDYQEQLIAQGYGRAEVKKCSHMRREIRKKRAVVKGEKIWLEEKRKELRVKISGLQRRILELS